MATWARNMRKVGIPMLFVYDDMIYRHMRELANQDLNDRLEKHWIGTLEQQSVRDFFFLNCLQETNQMLQGQL